MQTLVVVPPLPKIKATLFMFKVNRYLSKSVYLSVHEDSLIIINVFQNNKIMFVKHNHVVAMSPSGKSIQIFRLSA